MRVISRRVLRDFAKDHPHSGGPLDAWCRIAKAAQWKNLTELRKTWPSTDIVGDLTVFNIKGNTYRLIARINYPHRTIFVRAILTHAEYDENDWKRL